MTSRREDSFKASVFAVCVAFAAASVINFQIDDFAKHSNIDTNRVFPRSKASNERTVWLFSGECISIGICLPEEDTLTVSNVRFSNDGESDIVAVDIDENIISSFNSSYDTSFGSYWNIFADTGPIGLPVSLAAGSHVLTLTVVEADDYGVELDEISLVFGGKYRLADILCPGNGVSKCYTRSLQRSSITNGYSNGGQGESENEYTTTSTHQDCKNRSCDAIDLTTNTNNGNDSNSGNCTGFDCIDKNGDDNGSNCEESGCDKKDEDYPDTNGSVGGDRGSTGRSYDNSQLSGSNNTESGNVDSTSNNRGNECKGYDCNSGSNTNGNPHGHTKHNDGNADGGNTDQQRGGNSKRINGSNEGDSGMSGSVCGGSVCGGGSNGDGAGNCHGNECNNSDIKTENCDGSECNDNNDDGDSGSGNSTNGIINNVVNTKNSGSDQRTGDSEGISNNRNKNNGYIRNRGSNTNNVNNNRNISNNTDKDIGTGNNGNDRNIGNNEDENDDNRGTGNNYKNTETGKNGSNRGTENNDNERGTGNNDNNRGTENNDNNRATGNKENRGTVNNDNNRGTVNNANTRGAGNNDNNRGTVNNDNNRGTGNNDNNRGTVNNHNRGAGNNDNNRGTVNNDNNRGTVNNANTRGAGNNDNNRGTVNNDNNRGTGNNDNNRGTVNNHNRGAGNNDNNRGTVNNDNNRGTVNNDNRGAGNNDNNRGTVNNDNNRGTGNNDNNRGTVNNDNRGAVNNDNNRGTGNNDNNRGTGNYDNNRGTGNNDNNRGTVNNDNRGAGNNDNNRGTVNNDNNRGTGNNDNNRGTGNNDNNRGTGNYDNNRGTGNNDNNRGTGNNDNKRGNGNNDIERGTGNNGTNRITGNYENNGDTGNNSKGKDTGNNGYDASSSTDGGDGTARKDGNTIHNIGSPDAPTSGTVGSRNTSNYDESYLFECPRREIITMIRYNQVQCSNGMTRFDIFTSEVTEIIMSIWKSSKDQHTHRSRRSASVGDTKDPNNQIEVYPMWESGEREGSCEKIDNVLEEDVIVINVTEKNKMFPVIVDPANTKYLTLAFNVNSTMQETIFGRSISSIFTVGIRCMDQPTYISARFTDPENNKSAVLYPKRFTRSLIWQTWTFPFLTAGSGNFEMTLNFTNASEPFGLHFLRFDLQKTFGPLLPWAFINPTFGFGGKIVNLAKSDTTSLDGVEVGKGPKMRVRMRGSGSGRQMTSLILSSTEDGDTQMLPKFIFNQNGSALFYPDQSPDAQPVFVMGNDDSNGLAPSPVMDISRVDITSNNSAYELNIMTRSFRRATVLVSIEGNKTTVNLKASPSIADQHSPLCSLMLPCWGVGYGKTAIISADGTQTISMLSPWRSFMGHSIEMQRSPNVTDDQS